jgi:hypothetical protein
VHCFLINKHYNFSNSGYIFVDFSRYNIRLFTNDKWIEYLLKTGLRVVLIADRLAQPLALYWKHRCQQIVSIINTSDTRNEIEKKIQLSFLGQRDGRGYRQKLSDQEVLVLDLLLAEKSVKEIANELQMAEKGSTQSSSACRIRWEAEEVKHYSIWIKSLSVFVAITP